MTMYILGSVIADLLIVGTLILLTRRVDILEKYRR